MRILNSTEVEQEVAKALGKWCLHLHAGYGNDDTDELANNGCVYTIKELNKAVPYLTEDQARQLLFDGGFLVVCDNKEECERFYSQTVGDDGPTKTNPYNGLANVYALTISDHGVLMAENT